MPLSEKERAMADDCWNVQRNFYSFARSNGSSERENERDEAHARAVWLARVRCQFGATFQRTQPEQDEDAAE